MYTVKYAGKRANRRAKGRKFLLTVYRAHPSDYSIDVSHDGKFFITHGKAVFTANAMEITFYPDLYVGFQAQIVESDFLTFPFHDFLSHHKGARLTPID